LSVIAPENVRFLAVWRIVEINRPLWQTLVMDIDVTDFSTIQQLAPFDLLILATYADGHLARVEDELLQQLLATLGHTDQLDRQHERRGCCAVVVKHWKWSSVRQQQSSGV
jgi:hypothetical protein